MELVFLILVVTSLAWLSAAVLVAQSYRYGWRAGYQVSQEEGYRAGWDAGWRAGEAQERQAWQAAQQETEFVPVAAVEDEPCTICSDCDAESCPCVNCHPKRD